MKSRAKQIAKNATKSHLLFPLLLLVVVVGLTVFKINGSSIGVYHHFLFGIHSKDPDLIAGHPRYIRSDEWEYNTPMVVGQSANNYARINDNIGHGQDMSIIVDAPYKDWAAIFTPQNWPFFLLPLEYAFAMKWWLLGYLLIVSCYYFTLQFLPKKFLWAALLSLSFFFSPFIQWWYQTITIAPLFYSFFIMTVCLYILKRPVLPAHRYLLGGLLSYLLVCFALVQYPPFQVPCAIVSGLFVFGCALTKTRKRKWRAILPNIAIIGVSGLISFAVALAFLSSRSEAVNAARSTIYPGKRVVASGGFGPERFLSSPLLSQLQDDQKAAKYSFNQSEASSFIQLAPFALIPLLGLAVSWFRKKGQIDWLVLGLVIAAILLLARIFIPGLAIPSKLLLLESVPHVRTIIAFGLLGVLSTIILIQRQEESRIRTPRVYPVILGGVIFGAYVVASFVIKNANPGFITNNFKILLSCLAVSLVVPLIMYRKYTYALCLLFAISFASSYRVNPLYRGLGPLVKGELSSALRSNGTQEDRWVVADYVEFENFATANDRLSLSGVYTYPQKQLWNQIGNQLADEYIYNRFAHAFFSIDPGASEINPSGAYFDPPAGHAFRVHADPCGGFFKRKSVDYVLTTQQYDASCMQLVDEVTYPATKFFIYHIQQ